MNPFAPSIWKMALFCSLMGLAVYFVARPFIPRASDLAWDQTVAAFPSRAAPQALVHGWAKSPLEGCHYSLLWKAGSDKWFVFELDRNGATWDHYQLRQEGETVMVVRNGAVVGVLDPGKGEFDHIREKRVDKVPAAVIHADNLDHEAQWIYWDADLAAP